MRVSLSKILNSVAAGTQVLVLRSFLGNIWDWNHFNECYCVSEDSQRREYPIKIWMTALSAPGFGFLIFPHNEEIRTHTWKTRLFIPSSGQKQKNMHPFAQVSVSSLPLARPAILGRMSDGLRPHRLQPSVYQSFQRMRRYVHLKNSDTYVCSRKAWLFQKI